MDYKIGIVCNTFHPDHIQYFKNEIDVCIDEYNIENIIALKNSNYLIRNDVKQYNSSFGKSSFFSLKILYDIFVAFYILIKLKRNNVKLLHYTTAHISNIFVAILAKLFSIKLIFTIHDLKPHPGNKSFFIKSYNKLVTNFLANKIILLNKSDFEISDDKRFHYIPLSGFPQYIDIPKSGSKIVFFGRIDKYKGLDNLYKIITNYNKTTNSNQVEFIIAGKGELPKVYNNCMIKNLTIINRFIDDEELVTIFKDAKFIILPYDSATQSGVIILSYSYATPVIIFDVGALKEYVDDKKTGFIFKHNDIEGITNFLLKMDDIDIIKTSKNVIEKFKTNYSIQAFNSYYRDFFNNCISELKI